MRNNEEERPLNKEQEAQLKKNEKDLSLLFGDLNLKKII